MASHTVYAVASGKGGVGKTATTVNLGASLAEAGYNVAIVDTDLGMANLGGFIGVEPEQTLHEVLAGEATLEEATYEALNGLAVVPSGISLNGFANVETPALADAVDALRDTFDYVLLDLGAGLSHDTVLPLALADAVVLVSTPQPLSVQDTAKTREITERLGGRVAGVVLTRAGDPADLDHEDVEDRLDLPVLAVIPEDDAVPASAREGQAVLQYDPDSPAVEGYRGLADIVEEESLEDAPVVPEFPEPTTGHGEAAAPGEGEGASPADATDAPTDGAPAESGEGTQPAGESAAAGGEPAGESAATDEPGAEAATDGATRESAGGEPGGGLDEGGPGSQAAAGDEDAEQTAAEIAAAIEDAADDAAVGGEAPDENPFAQGHSAEEPATADEPEASDEPATTDAGSAEGATVEDAGDAATGPGDDAAAGTGDEEAGGGDAGTPVDELFGGGDEGSGGDEADADAAAAEADADAGASQTEGGEAEGGEAEAALSVESGDDDDSEEGEAVDELFSVEGASPDDIEDDDEEEDSGGLLGGLLG